MDFGFVNVAAIMALAFFLGQAIKASPINDKYIPICVGAFGIIIGMVAFLCKVPDFPANDLLNAAAVGLSSAWTATGAHQVYKQLTKK